KRAFPDSLPVPVISETLILIPNPRILVDPSIPSARPLSTLLVQMVLSLALTSTASTTVTAPTTSAGFVRRKAIFTSCERVAVSVSCAQEVMVVTDSNQAVAQYLMLYFRFIRR